MADSFSRVSVVGLGYIGLPTAATLAAHGLDVIGIDIDTRVVEAINAGRAHFQEPDLDRLVSSAVQSGHLQARGTAAPAEAFLIAVPTPTDDRHAPDLSFVEAAARSIAPVLQRGNLVVLESTSPVGTTELLADWIADLRPDLRMPKPGAAAGDIAIAYCPERILPGRMVHELVHNDRIIGGISPTCASRAESLYATFVRGRRHLTSARVAEFVKLAENAYRDVNIAFANELSLAGAALGVDVWEAIALANHHPRVDILSPGPGVGGHCIAVDPWFLIHGSPANTPLMRAARTVNDAKPNWVVETIRRHCDGLRHPVVACLGLAYKADVDDLRESPAVRIVEALAQQPTGELLAVEPNVRELPARLQNGVNRVTLTPLEEALRRADVIALLVDHAEFRAVPAEALSHAAVVDTRGLWRATGTRWTPKGVMAAE